MNSFIVFIAIAAIIASVILPLLINEKRTRQGEKKKIPAKTMVIGVVAGLALLVLSDSFVIIPTGYTGVRLTFGQVDETPVPNGFNWKVPFVQDIERVNNKQQDLNFYDRIWSETKDRTAIFFSDITVTYQVMPEKSAWIYANVTDYDNSLVSAGLVASAIKASSKQLVDSDATNRSIIEPLAQESIQKSLDDKYGPGVVYVNKVVISQTDFEDSYNEAIAAKQKANLEAEQQAIENQRNIDKATAEAEALRIQTQAEADAKLIAAKAEADAALIKAEAEAEANKKLQATLTPEILRQLYLQAWNGELPEFLGGDSSSILVDLTGKE